MSATSRYLTAAETAALVRKALKAAYPAVKFSVRSKTYAGGASIDIGWGDGPSLGEVEATAKLYQGTTPHGIHRQSLLSSQDGAEVVRYGASYVFCNRRLSPAFTAELANEIAAFTGAPYDPNRQYHATALNAPGSDQPGTLRDSPHETSWGSDLLHRLARNRARPTTPTAA